MFAIYKKIDPKDPTNHRGNSIMSAIVKIYYMVLNARFNLWYKPKIEQAGTQKGVAERSKFLLPNY